MYLTVFTAMFDIGNIKLVIRIFLSHSDCKNTRPSYNKL